jgi:uncharacterized protein YbjT (DUF2867 family)
MSIIVLVSLLVAVLVITTHAAVKTVTVFGASGGVGQLICSRLKSESYKVRAITRDAPRTILFPMLQGCDVVEADARVPATLARAVKGSDVVVISVGTTAFPSSKWDGGNTPQAACVDSVVNILAALSKTPEKVILISSIGVERANEV